MGQIWTKSKEIKEIFRSFIMAKAIFADTQTDGDISALRAGVPRSSAHQKSTLGMVPYHIGIVNKLNVYNGHKYVFQKVSGNHFLGVVFDWKLHRDLSFSPFSWHSTVVSLKLLA